MKCKWRGYETDLLQVQHKTIRYATQSVCPTCGCDSYMHMTEREIAAWERSTAATTAGDSKEGASDE